MSTQNSSNKTYIALTQSELQAIEKYETERFGSTSRISHGAAVAALCREEIEQ